MEEGASGLDKIGFKEPNMEDGRDPGDEVAVDTVLACDEPTAAAAAAVASPLLL